MVEGLGCCGSTQEGGGVGDIKYPNAYGGFRFLFPQSTVISSPFSRNPPQR